MTHDSHTHATGVASRKRLGWALGLTASVLIVEVVGAWVTGSLALLADAGHMAADSFGLVVALVAAVLMTKPPSSRRTWGYARAEVLAAGLQSGILIGLTIVIAFEAISRLFDPVEVVAAPMLWIGSIGLVANIGSLVILSGGRRDSLNMKAAFLEVMADALGSFAVIVAALITLSTGWVYADSAASLLIAVMIVVRAALILRQTAAILMEQTPPGLDLDAVRDALEQHPSVVEVHDMHASSIGTGLNTFTAHVVVEEECVEGGLTVNVLHDLQDLLETGFPIALNHVTLQIDSKPHAAHEGLAH